MNTQNSSKISNVVEILPSSNSVVSNQKLEVINSSSKLRINIRKEISLIPSRVKPVNSMTSMRSLKPSKITIE